MGMILEYHKKSFVVSTDKSRLDIEFIHNALKNSYWASSIPKRIVEKSIRNSIAYGIYEFNKQIGFARVITDEATFAYLADVIISEDSRGSGLGQWLIKCIMENPLLRELKLFLLSTQNAHELFKKIGFQKVENSERFMEIFRTKIY